ncbi:tRNA(Ile)-lysidine synthetase [Ehrlichia chaffeensis str. Liberty]|uniref:tRNA(Ile)-lysidine synthase n=2 Tax=Ehrlichia chaffeensis TaxID=945 RepID=Q2GFA2_EHRCR|nr:tRNA lysidine(34) synthetase TilS [Ehrlichia chaffeensis]AHX06164.1 tRNA(Ile)-lysidine synthetase [Ehrlichia chaffeensis str. Liberty]ABD44830.1 tRNA(Ile)-lysidine synthetase [Ehrlichia chaffeensis str. Arkansas]AHX05175.1 tRNA(Ile)-lysidine synthetase [Ehrlichia chaffeensis str. Jax]AHX07390.1 tRNA(Ile)-lysidine synthetase [Ehrlichia chaffeensis str. Osceola]AHX10698.1 tRNA(Ile)-lysidine synthetase [Ehrlichia chaffeensis str. West Paces]
MINLGLLFQKKIQNLNDNFAIAVSGGIDSMTLLHLSARYCNKNTPIVLTVNHGLRPEAAQEALFVFQHSQNLNLKCHILNWHGKLPESNIQSSARRIRYKLLLQWCNENRIKYLMVAHQKNDQAETIMIRLERGSGLDGLAGMQEYTYLNGICILRPLLSASRTELLQYANKNNITWINDTSNNNKKYKRTLYRNMLEITDNPEVLINRLYTASEHIKRSLNCILHYVRLATDQCLEFTNLGHINIKLDIFLTLPEEISIRLLTYSIMSIGQQKYKPRYSKLSNIFSKIKNNKHKIAQTLCGCKITTNHNNIISITREVSAIQELTINSATNIVIEWDNRFKISIVNSNADNVTVSSLNNNYIPEELKKLHREAVRCLPILKHKNKIVAYPLQNNSNNNYIDQVKSSIIIKEVLVKQNFINLTYSEFISKEPLL